MRSGLKVSYGTPKNFARAAPIAGILTWNSSISTVSTSTAFLRADRAASSNSAAEITASLTRKSYFVLRTCGFWRCLSAITGALVDFLEEAQVRVVRLELALVVHVLQVEHPLRQSDVPCDRVFGDRQFQVLEGVEAGLDLGNDRLFVLSHGIDRQPVGVKEGTNVGADFQHDFVHVARGVDLVGDGLEILLKRQPAVDIRGRARMRLQYRAHRQSTLRFVTAKYPDNQLLYHCSARVADPSEAFSRTNALQAGWRFRVSSACRGFSRPSCSTLRLPPEPAREQERAVPALSEEKCRGGAASPALAIEDVLFPFVQHAESVANFRQRNIDGTRKPVILIFRRVTHIDPLGSIGDLVARLLCRYAVQQRFPEELGKVLP